MSAPHSLALSYLNALVDDSFPIFKAHRKDFAVENLGWFYLMTQYIHREKSFWKPYLDTLPRPEAEWTTPLWFDEPADLPWIEGTDVLHTMLGRRKVYEEYYATGVAALKRGGMDTTPYTWDLYRWAISISTSRSFSSRSLQPTDSKYWAAYKTNAQGKRQVVLLDMSRTPAEDLDFPVLFPAMDAGNHEPEARVDWDFTDPGRFTVRTNDATEPDIEIFNNYGPKGNDELLLGYGFCIPGNPNDGVIVTPKPPPSELQLELKSWQPGWFKDRGMWNGEKCTFRLQRPHNPARIWSELPASLLELLTYIIRHERGLPFVFIDNVNDDLLQSPEGHRYLPHIARMIVTSLAPKLQKLQAVDLPPEGPSDAKQRQAAIYRNGQLEILQSLIAALRSFTRSLLKPASANGPRFVTLEGLLELWGQRAQPQTLLDFVGGIEAVSGTADVSALRQAGWEDDVLALAVCCIYLSAETIADGGLNESNQWVLEMLPSYIEPAAPNEATQDPDALARAESLLELVATASQHVDSQTSVWHDSRWSAALIAEVGGKMLQFESMPIMVPKPDGRGEEARVVLYVHSLQGELPS